MKTNTSKTMRRVHVTLAKDLLNDPGRMEQLKQKLVDDHSMSQVNEKRLKRYGIMSGMLPENKFDEVRKLGGVESVDLDEVRHALE